MQHFVAHHHQVLARRHDTGRRLRGIRFRPGRLAQRKQTVTGKTGAELSRKNGRRAGVTDRCSDAAVHPSCLLHGERESEPGIDVVSPRSRGNEFLHDLIGTGVRTLGDVDCGPQERLGLRVPGLAKFLLVVFEQRIHVTLRK